MRAKEIVLKLCRHDLDTVVKWILVSIWSGFGGGEWRLQKEEAATNSSKSPFIPAPGTLLCAEVFLDFVTQLNTRRIWKHKKKYLVSLAFLFSFFNF